MQLRLECKLMPDRFGHHHALLQRGDWLYVIISDGRHSGVGEASLSGDDALCIKRVRELFDKYLKGMALILDNIRQIKRVWLTEQPDFLTATAISGIDQALYDLLGKREGVPVWQLVTPGSIQETVPVYVTINRALRERSFDDYYAVVDNAGRKGFSAIKCAPFEAVNNVGDQLAQSEYGRSVLSALRTKYPELGLRIDFHQRFSAECFIQLLPELDDYSPHWYEEPCEIGSVYQEIAASTSVPIAAGELYNRVEDLTNLMDTGWVNIIMPDVKHVGGFGSLLNILQEAADRSNIEVSLHNPSGPVSTMASLHAAVISSAVTSIELPFQRGTIGMPYQKYLENGNFVLPTAPGWGIDYGD
jgi:galactonate dehydratase